MSWPVDFDALGIEKILSLRWTSAAALRKLRERNGKCERHPCRFKSDSRSSQPAQRDVLFCDDSRRGPSLILLSADTALT